MLGTQIEDIWIKIDLSDSFSIKRVPVHGV